jgi:hypothetical protein
MVAENGGVDVLVLQRKTLYWHTQFSIFATR